MQIQHHFVKSRIVAVRAVTPGKAQKIRVLLLIFPLEQLPDYTLPDQFSFLLIEQAEFRIDVDCREVFTNQLLTKRVQRGN